MFEITVDGVAYPLRFGMGFLREINRTVQTPVDGAPGVKNSVGLRHMAGRLIDGQVEALLEVIYLANKNSEVLSLIGPGVINKCALNCYMEVLPNIHTIKIRGSSSKSKTALAMKAYIEEKYPQVKDVIICDSLKEACQGADVVSEAMLVTKENMEEFKLEWFKKGATVFSMGSFLYRKYDDFLSTTMVVDNYGMYEKYMSNFKARGEYDAFGNKREWVIMGIHFVHLVQTGKIPREKVINISDIVNGTSTGRKSKDEIVMCSIGGMPLEDLSWGYDCYQKALELGIGTKLNLWDKPYYS